jgi:hypothetical protein
MPVDRKDFAALLRHVQAAEAVLFAPGVSLETVLPQAQELEKVLAKLRAYGQPPVDA